MIFKKIRKGFTLLEVAIAMSILIVAMTALMGHEGIAIQMSDYSNKLSQATLLLQGKMLDVEYKLLKDGMDQLDDCEEGDFHEEEMRAFKWKACATKLEMSEGAPEQIVEQIKAALAGFTPMGAGDDKAAANIPTPDDMNNPMDAIGGNIEMIAGALPMLLQSLEDKVRKVRVEVTWKDAIAERSLVIERFITQLGEDRTDEGSEITDEDIAKDLADEAASQAIGNIISGQGAGSGSGSSGSGSGSSDSGQGNILGPGAGFGAGVQGGGGKAGKGGL